MLQLFLLISDYFRALAQVDILASEMKTFTIQIQYEQYLVIIDFRMNHFLLKRICKLKGLERNFSVLFWYFR